MKIKMVQWFDDHFYKITRDDNSVEYMPSVTTKLGAAPKPFLAKWRGEIGNREADLRVFEASEKGKRIHYACSLYLRGGYVIYNPYASPNYSKTEIDAMVEKGNEVFVLQDQDEMWQVAKFQKWIEIVNPEIIGIESTIWSEKYREAGTLDLLLQIEEGDYMINGHKPLHLESGGYVADLKSGGYYDEAALQVSAYASMVSEHMPDDIRPVHQPIGTLILHLNSSTKTGIPGLSTYLRNSDEMADDFQRYRHIAQVWEDQNIDAMPRLFDFPAIICKKEKLA
jgi:hypothetical protein